jgi:starch phosphorylase
MLNNEEEMMISIGKKKVAYFCMEFGLHESFHIYSGGLGILAGDILKSAKDLKVPMVGVGILWRQGYVQQHIDEQGKPFDSYHEFSYDFLKDTGKSVQVIVRGRPIKLKIWKCDNFGNVPLYLLDANLPENADRLITGQLYGWFSEERVAQEIILSVGGVKALRALGIKTDIYHFNDSHPVLAGTELIREKMDKGMGFDQAFEQTKKQIVFTTHTPVVAGNEVHEHELLQYCGAYNGLTRGQMIKLGGEPFSMTVAGIRISKKANAVAQLHGETARKMWSHVEGGEKILSITNGVHNGTWQDKTIINAMKKGEGLWDAHVALKKELLDEVNRRNGVQLDEGVLTIGFGRRAAPYKRSDLIFKKKAVIEDLLKNKKLQIIFAGKAHPNDLGGKEIIANIYRMSKKYPDSVVFLQNYDMKIGKLLTRGCDIWLNNPIRPMEASGTSGMKAAMNGVPNLSVLDGWWPEGCKHGVTGWQIGDGYEGKDADKVDSESLYKVLQKEVIPMYYNDNKRWVEIMKASIKMSSDQFSGARMVKDYYALMYADKKAK